MEISDLTIGDWVYDDYGKPYKIKSIGLLGNTDELFVMLDYNDLYQLNYIEPIPLTVEILEKNGFELTGDSTFEKKAYNDSYEKIRMDWWEKNNFYFGFYSRKEKTVLHISLMISYVHNLQHALRLCGLSEIADDFKI